MEFTRMRTLEAMFSLIRKGIENIIEYNESSDFPLEGAQIASFMTKWVIFSAVWGIGGSMNLHTRTAFSNKLVDFSDVETPSLSSGANLIDYEIRL
jgi:dynein heavy chain 1